MDPMKNSAVHPNYCHVTAHILTRDIRTNSFLGLEVVPDWPVLALLSYLIMGSEEDNTFEAHQNYLRKEDHKWKLLENDVTHSPLQRGKI